ncbi:MAG: DNA mismatch repair protein MutS, partial [Candidatus Eisenbacteria bacterium]|nr:DNA mismatch repair protein MutS [Candidatus Eisenbacteria bacterium]
MKATPDTAAAATSAAAKTPLMRQYLTTKQDYPDSFLFFRMGDFYELFFEDAVRAAQLLGITLTSRNKQDPEPIPMCGFPWHQRDGYVARLLRLGHKVAVCDQLEDPAQAKGLVQRGVTEVLTPGSVTSDTFLESGAHNWLGALWPQPARVGLCFADASTGEVRLAESAWSEAGPLLARLTVAEWLVPATLDEASQARVESLLGGMPGARKHRARAALPLDTAAAKRWEAQAGAHADLPLALHAASATLDYLDRTQGGAALQMTRVERWAEDALLRYDGATARHLELFTAQPGGEPRHTLWHHLDLTVTTLGARRLPPGRTPLASLEAHPRTAGRDRLVARVRRRARLPHALRGLPDLERLAARAACGKATPRDLGAMRDALQKLPALAASLSTREDAEATRAALTLPPALLARLMAA